MSWPGRLRIEPRRALRYLALTNAEFAPLFKLFPADRIQLVEDLWESIAHDDTLLPVTDEKREELRRAAKRVSKRTAPPDSIGSRSSRSRGIGT